MGGIFCCLGQPMTDDMQPIKAASPAGSMLRTEEKQKTGHMMSSSARNKLIRNLEYRTLEDCLLASPNFSAQGEAQIFKHLPKKVYPSSTSPGFSFSGPDSKLGRIDEEDDGNQGQLSRESNSNSRSSSGSGKVKKKVRFRLPEVADIHIYDTPEEGISRIVNKAKQDGKDE